MVYLKFQIECMREREELRAFEREKRCQEREKKREKYVYAEERKKNRKVRKI
jgi:hypothetical protein